LFFFGVLRLGVYFLIFCGWGSGRSYSSIGGYRSVAQTVSYEVSLILFGVLVVLFVGVYDLSSFGVFFAGFWVSFFSLPFFVCWLGLCLAETNRTPYDFAEGESELVSGFNVEYGGGLFSFIFICEYGMIILLSFFSCCLFLGGCFVFFFSFFVCF
jgi:NADH-ubiquinone oxidoreductase chain 1